MQLAANVCVFTLVLPRQQRLEEAVRTPTYAGSLMPCSASPKIWDDGQGPSWSPKLHQIELQWDHSGQQSYCYKTCMPTRTRCFCFPSDGQPKTGIKRPFCHALQCSLFPSCVWVTVQPQSKDHLCVVSCTMLPASFTNAQPKQLARAKIYRCSCPCPAKLYSAVKLGASSRTEEGWRGRASTGFLCKIMTMYGRNCSTYFRRD